MSATKPPESVWQGSFSLFGVAVRCHILDDGRRVIETDSLNELFDAMENDADYDHAQLREMEKFVRWQRGE